MKGKSFGNATPGRTIQKRNPADYGHTTQRTFMAAGAIVGAVLLIGAMVLPLGAQSYPNKPIRFILPFTPGGSSDILGRIVAQKLAERLGQPVVIENRPGAGGNVGFELGSRAKPDGYTILLGSPSLIISPSLYKKLNYDPIKDLAPISVLGANTKVIVVRSSLPVKNLKEFMEYARANPGKLKYGGTIGVAGQLAVEQIKSLNKINIIVVPYKGESQVLIGLLSGEVDMQAIAPELAMPQIQAGNVRALAVLYKERLPLLPNVPTAKEAGIENCEVSVWHGMLAPTGTPRDIINRLNAAWTKSAEMPDTKQQLRKAGFDTLWCTPEQFSESLKAEKERWAKVIEEAKIRLD